MVQGCAAACPCVNSGDFMTRIIIFGDLHANWEALLALQQAELRPDAILCLGDVVGYGPDPKRCLDAVRNSAARFIQGGHDRAVGGGASYGHPGLLQATWAYTRSMLSVADHEFLSALPASQTFEQAGARFLMTRLPPDNADTESQMLITLSQARLRDMFADVDADVILLGGPHIPAMRQIGQKVIVCPGSLGLPRYGVSDPTFVAWEDGRLQIHHLHYHPDKTIQKLSLLPLDPEYIQTLQNVLKTGGLEARS